jgi:CCR4-NOT transcription complex subunit 3
MAANRKLQQQVDSTLKKVDEGIEEFNTLFERVDPNMNPNQRVCFDFQ